MSEFEDFDGEYQDEKSRQYLDLSMRVAFGISLDDLRNKRVLSFGTIQESDWQAAQREYNFDIDKGNSQPFGQFARDKYDLILDWGHGVDYFFDRKGNVFKEILDEILRVLKKGGSYYFPNAIDDEDYFAVAGKEKMRMSEGDYQELRRRLENELNAALQGKANAEIFLEEVPNFNDARPIYDLRLKISKI